MTLLPSPTLTCLIALHLLQGWAGRLTSTVDGTSALFRAYTRSPSKLMLLELGDASRSPFPACAPTTNCGCVPNKTRAEHLLAFLNREAHHLATHAPPPPTPWAAPLRHVLPAALVLYY